MNSPEKIRVAVVTPYYREAPEILRECLASVAGQSYPCTHFMVADGHPQELIAGPAVEHIVLPRAHQDVGNTPRAIGSISAMNQGYDVVAYLDADNWYYPNHIESMVELQKASGADICTATRSIHRLDGSLMYVDTVECNGADHADTSCLFITRTAFRLLPVWAMMPMQMGPIGDKVMWEAIRGGRYRCAHYPQATVAFRTQYQVHYEYIGEKAPEGSNYHDESTGDALKWWLALPQEQRNEWAAYLGWSPY